MDMDHLVRIVAAVIYKCRDEAEFAEFAMYADAGTGWDWIGRKVRDGTLTGITLPDVPVGQVWPSRSHTEMLIGDARVGRRWDLSQLYLGETSISASASHATFQLPEVRHKFFAKLLKDLAASIADARLSSTNPLAGITMDNDKEGNITVTALAQAQTSCFLLNGESTAGWGDAAAAGSRFVSVVAGLPNGSPSRALAGISKEDADDMLGNL